jgi:hypothetical protein
MHLLPRVPASTALRRVLLALPLCGAALPALAADLTDWLTVNGYVDGRLVLPSDQKSWMEGGLGKLRFDGGSDHGGGPRFDAALADIRIGPFKDAAFYSTVRANPEQRTAVDLLESYLRYAPLEMGPVRWSAKLGAFFPPISLENEGVGWSSPWTLTPSAINSWVGEELRTIGGEGRVDWRMGHRTLGLVLAAYGWNDPAGVMVADRGWTFDDRPTGLFDKLRLPDAFARSQRAPIPLTTPLFKEIDNRPGWYAGASWTENDIGRLSYLHYDNAADPTARSSGTIAWHTYFDSLGLDTAWQDFTILAQAMAGETVIKPSPTFSSTTRFQAAYLLIGRYFGAWNAALRGDLFGTQDHRPSFAPDLSEHGYAVTAAVGWQPQRWIKLTAEALYVNSFRTQRLQSGLAPEAGETQLQLSARFFY